MTCSTRATSRLVGSIARIACASALVVAFCGCSDDGEEATGDIELRPFAYVVNECSETSSGWSGHRGLRIRNGEGEEIVVNEFVLHDLGPQGALCRVYGMGRQGGAALAAGGIQRLGVSPDASTVVFETTDDYSIFSTGTMAPEEEGIFQLNADGSGLRRIGDASRNPAFRLVLPDPNAALGVTISHSSEFRFSPNGKRIAYTDRGIGIGGVDAIQIFTIDLSTGERRQVTRLPPITRQEGTDVHEVLVTGFLTDDLLTFVTDEVNQAPRAHIVRVDGDGEVVDVSLPAALPGAAVAPEFKITRRRAVVPLQLSGQISELFAVTFDRESGSATAQLTDVLQLTHFGRPDTGGGTEYSNRGKVFVTRDGTRAVFSASPEPLETNPLRNCQLYSIDTLGGELRQLTTFVPASPLPQDYVCGLGPPPSCSLLLIAQDLPSDSVFFEGNCDPQGGGLLTTEGYFVMRADGSGIRQIIDTRGAVTDASGRLSVELAGPFAYPESFD